jgi:peptidoglycan/xylan/chitin deacetylase (PgdA/CDA1 family)
MYINENKFSDRISHLLSNNYKIIPLSEAIKMLSEKSLPDHSVAITVDDGFESTYHLAHPILKKYNLPYTIYLTTYYFQRNDPILNLSMHYAVWKSQRNSVTVPNLSPDPFTIKNTTDKNVFCRTAYSYINDLHDPDNKNHVWSCILDQLGVTSSDITNNINLKLLKHEQAVQMASDGVDFQLHTHCHTLYEDIDKLTHDININHDIISNITSTKPSHLCYPSGMYSKQMLPALSTIGIESAATCIPGLNDESTSVLLLKRYIDSEQVSQIEYEAMISGFMHCCTKLINGIETFLGYIKMSFYAAALMTTDTSTIAELIKISS